MLATNPVAGSTDLRALMAQMGDEAVIDARELEAATACSIRHIDRLIAAGKGPRPLRALGSKARRWRLGDVRAWLRGEAQAV